MIIKSANFVGSFPRMDMCPESELPEFAFIGRSNVGKSTLINLLTNRNKLAKVSQTPGKTQLINFFLINEQWHLVDLPGYGYAKSSKSNRASWGTMIRKYLGGRENLKCTFVLIDSRLPPQKIDLEFMNWMGQEGLPFVLVFTKADKNGPKVVLQNVAKFKETMLLTWDEVPQTFITSSTQRTGHQEILNFIGEVVITSAEELAEWKAQVAEEAKNAPAEPVGMDEPDEVEFEGDFDEEDEGIDD
ncbi:ribosome biogenesis GTP-binding protein YihA/YsxC [soil metagenome]